MKAQITNAQITETLAIIKGVKASQINNINWTAGTFELGKGVYQFDLTKTRMVKTNSVKFFSSIESYANGTY